MKVDELLEQLQKQKQLIEAFSSIKISFNGKHISTEVKDIVKQEIVEYAQKRIQEIDTNTVQKNESEQESKSLTQEDVKLLKHFISKLMNKTQPTSKTSAGVKGTNPDDGIVNQAIKLNIKRAKYAKYGGQKVQVLAVSQDKASIRLSDNSKIKVNVQELAEI